MADHQKFLKTIYSQQNQLRQLGEVAAKIEQEDGISVFRGNVGDPTGPTLRASNEAMAKYYLTRPDGTGYTDHRGEPELRKIAADLLNRIDRLKGPLKFDGNKVFCVAGGTGGLNTALSVFKDENTRVLVTDPFYPPWDPISERNHLKVDKFPLRREDNYLLNEEILRKKLEDKTDPHKNKPVVLMYHYPHNPTGKTLDRKEARQVADTLNNLVKEFPNLYLIQEDLYLATVRSDKGIYTPMEFLSPEALERTMLVHSPSKEGHGQDRGALVATPSEEIATSLRGSTSFSNLGMSTGALIGTVVTLADIATGIDPKTEANKGNHRYVTADYYQERMEALGQGFLRLEKPLSEKLGRPVEILDRVGDKAGTGIPEGTYYLWPKLDFLKGLPIPAALQYDTEDQNKITHHDTIETSRDIQYMLSHAHHIGFMPVMAAQGELFTGDKNKPNQNPDMRIRFAAVERDTARLKEASNTIEGVIGTVMGLNLQELGVKTRTQAELREEFPPKSNGVAQKIMNNDVVQWITDVLGDPLKKIFMVGRN